MSADVFIPEKASRECWRGFFRVRQTASCIRIPFLAEASLE